MTAFLVIVIFLFVIAALLKLFYDFIEDVSRKFEELDNDR